MKTCQNCNARSKDDVLECLHCGTLFGDLPKAESKTTDEKAPKEEESAVKQTLFGIPAQKLEDLLAARDQESEEDLSKKTMAGFNISGLFGDSKNEEKGMPEPVAIEPNEPEEIPQIISRQDTSKTMAGLNVSDLIKDAAEAAEAEKPAKKETPEDPKFGTMLGINVADIMAYSAGKADVEEDSSRTLFSLPAVDSPLIEGQAPDKPVGPKGKTDTAAGGFSAAIKGESEVSEFKRTPSKVSLGSLIPKVALQKKDKPPVIAARSAVQTPVEFSDHTAEEVPDKNKQTASGILRKSKPASQKSAESKKKSGVLGSYIVGKEVVEKENVGSEVSEVSRNTSPPFPEADPIGDKPVQTTVQTAKLSDVPVKSDTETPDALNPVEAAQPEPASLESSPGSAAAHVDIPKAAVEPEVKKKNDRNYEGSINTIQFVFVVLGALIILGTAVAFFAKDLNSAFNLVSVGLSGLTLLGSLAVLFGSKNAILKGAVWMFSALVLFVLGVIGAFFSTPLAILFVFGGAPFLLAALFPKIVSLT